MTKELKEKFPNLIWSEFEAPFKVVGYIGINITTCLVLQPIKRFYSFNKEDYEIDYVVFELSLDYPVKVEFYGSYEEFKNTRTITDNS
jgi:hypothetical protein